MIYNPDFSDGQVNIMDEVVNLNLIGEMKYQRPDCKD